MACLFSSELYCYLLCYRKSPRYLFKKKASQTTSSTTNVSTQNSKLLLYSQPHSQPINDLTEESWGEGWSISIPPLASIYLLLILLLAHLTLFYLSHLTFYYSSPLTQLFYYQLCSSTPKWKDKNSKAIVLILFPCQLQLWNFVTQSWP